MCLPPAACPPASPPPSPPGPPARARRAGAAGAASRSMRPYNGSALQKLVHLVRIAWVNMDVTKARRRRPARSARSSPAAAHPAARPSTAPPARANPRFGPPCPPQLNLFALCRCLRHVGKIMVLIVLALVGVIWYSAVATAFVPGLTSGPGALRALWGLGLLLYTALVGAGWGAVHVADLRRATFGAPLSWPPGPRREKAHLVTHCSCHAAPASGWPHPLVLPGHFPDPPGLRSCRMGALQGRGGRLVGACGVGRRAHTSAQQALAAQKALEAGRCPHTGPWCLPCRQPCQGRPALLRSWPAVS